MKKFTLLLLGTMLCANVGFAAQTASRKQYLTRNGATEVYYNTKGEKQTAKPATIARAAADAIIRATQEEVYEFNPEAEAEAEQWELSSTYTVEFDKKGNELVRYENSEGFDFRYTYEYNENGMVTKFVTSGKVGDEWIDLEIKEYDYDSRVTDFVIFYKWSQLNQIDLSMQVLASHRREIDRDDAGNVTEMRLLVQFDDEYELYEKTVIEYGEDGKATSYALYGLDMDENGNIVLSEDALHYDDIVWENTDGQIVQSEEMFVLGANRIKSATKSDETGMVFNFEVTYTTGRDFNAVLSTEEGEQSIHSIETTDEYGSYVETFKDVADMDEDGEISDEEVMWYEYMEVTRDEYGNDILGEMYMQEDPEIGPELVGGDRFTYTYGDNAEILQYVSEQFDYDLNDYTFAQKVVFSNFINVAEEEVGVDNVRLDPSFVYSISRESVEFTMDDMTDYVLYNINGAMLTSGRVNGINATISISSYPQGIYILKVNGTQNSNTLKFIKK